MPARGEIITFKKGRDGAYEDGPYKVLVSFSLSAFVKGFYGVSNVAELSDDYGKCYDPDNVVSILLTEGYIQDATSRNFYLGELVGPNAEDWD